MATESKCRTCGHCWESHNHHGRKMCHEMLSEDYDPGAVFCDCDTGWISDDNLEFLEQEYAKRGKSMEPDKCKKCSCIQLAHTGKAGSVNVGFGAVVYCGEGYCISCISKPTPCFAFEK
jgi:hypothetical protein